MKILFIKDTRGSDGIEGTGIYLLNLCKYLNAINTRYLVLYNSNDRYSELLTENNISYNYLNFPTFSLFNNFKIFKLFNIRNYIYKIIKKEKITHIVLQDPYLQIFISKSIDIPILCYQHAAFNINENKRSRNFYHYLHLIIKKYYNKCKNINKVVCVSNASYLTSTIQYKIPKKKCIINNYGIEEIEPTKKNVNKTEINILSVASIYHDKGVEDFCKVAKYIKLNYQNYNFNFIFVGGYRSKRYSNLIMDKYKNYVKFEGIQKNLFNYYNSADIFLFLSHRESAGQVIMEAMRHKLLIIASDIFGINEIIINNKNGFLVDYKNHKKISETLITQVQNKKKFKNITNNAYNDYLKNYTIKKSSMALLEIIKNTY